MYERSKVKIIGEDHQESVGQFEEREDKRYLSKQEIRVKLKRLTRQLTRTKDAKGVGRLRHRCRGQRAESEVTHLSTVQRDSLPVER